MNQQSAAVVAIAAGAIIGGYFLGKLAGGATIARERPSAGQPQSPRDFPLFPAGLGLARRADPRRAVFRGARGLAGDAVLERAGRRGTGKLAFRVDSMTGRQVAYAVPVALSVLACAVAFSLVWRRRAASPSVGLYAVVLGGEVVWCFGYLLEIVSPSLGAKLFWDKVQLLPAYVTSLEAFRFALRLAGVRDARRAKLAPDWLGSEAA